MLRNVFLKTLRDQRRGLIGWSIGLTALVAMTAAIWPSLSSIKNFDKMLAQYPDALKKLFDMEAMTTGSGYLNAELFSLTIPVVFLIYAIARGVRLTASEEEQGTFEILLTMPYSRPRILLHKAGALTASVTLLGLVLFISTWAVAIAFNMDVGVGEIAGAALAMALLGIEYGLITLAVGAMTGKRGTTLAVAGVFAVASYLFYALGAFVNGLEPWRVLSPFFQALDGGPVGAGFPLSYLWMPLVGIVVLCGALPVFKGRDVAV